MKKIYSVMLLAAMLLCSMDAAAERTTRDLVFDDSEGSAAAPSSDTQTLAVKTTIALVRDGQNSTVTPTHEFKSGDSIKVVFTPNVDGYVYWLAKGSSGKHSVLFPSPKSGMDNAVKRNQEYTVPPKGSFKFDAQAGSEELLCILAPEKLADLEKLVAEAAAGNVSDATNKAVATLDQSNTEKRTTRDLVFDDEDDKDVNTKSQQAAKGTPFVAHYVLTHK